MKLINWQLRHSYYISGIHRRHLYLATTWIAGTHSDAMCYQRHTKPTCCIYSL